MATPNSNFATDVAVTTIKNRRRRLADNVLNHNSLLRFLNQQGNVNLAAGGETLVEELEYAENGTFMYYSGYETLNINPSMVFSAAEFDWKQASVVVSASGLELRKNSGREAFIRLLDRRIRNAEKTMQNNLSTGVYSDGTGSSGKQIGGLQLLVADTPTSGTVGGIDRSAFSFWQNITYDATTTGGAAATAALIQGYMNAVWIQLVRGGDSPKLIVAASDYFNLFWQSLQAIQRLSSPQMGSSGFESLTYYGPGGSAPVFYDDTCPATHMYFLNSDYLFWRPHSDANMEPLAERNSLNQDAMVVPIIFQGNMTMSNASLQGVLKD